MASAWTGSMARPRQHQTAASNASGGAALFLPSHAHPIRPLPPLPLSEPALSALTPLIASPSTYPSDVTHLKPEYAENPIQPMPDHWNNDFPGAWPCLRPMLKLVFTALVVIAFGHPTLEQKWKMTQSGEAKYTEELNRIAGRLTTITVVAGLLLSCLVALITTSPPAPAILDYTQRMPYLCLWASFGLLLGGLIVGSADIFVMGTCSPDWTHDRLMATRARVIFVLIFLAYPFFTVGGATLSCVFGLLVAAWLSEDRTFQVGWTALVLMPLSLAFAFMWGQMSVVVPRSRRMDGGKDAVSM